MIDVTIAIIIIALFGIVNGCMVGCIIGMNEKIEGVKNESNN